VYRLRFLSFLYFGFTLQKILPPKIFGFRILNLTLHAREARGVAENPWFSLAHTKENASEKNLVSSVVALYHSARTYFSRNPSSLPRH